MTLPKIPVEVTLDSLNSREGTERRVHCFDDPGDKARRALEVALGANRPLLVQGEPGVGKTQLAEAAAKALNRVLLSVTVDSRTESRDLLYSFDAVRRLSEAQLLGVLGANAFRKQQTQETNSTPLPEAVLEALRRDLDPQNFVVPGLLWWAFDWTSAASQATRAQAAPIHDAKAWEAAEGGSVLLIDEIDKAEADVPNGLLEALGSRRFGVPAGLPDVVMQPQHPPLVIITTNQERTLPDPFLRRCVVLTLELPPEDPRLGSESSSQPTAFPSQADGASPPQPQSLAEFLKKRGKAHFPQVTDEVLNLAAERLVCDRRDARAAQALSPGQAEFLDLLRATLASADSSDEQLKNLQVFSEFVFRKYNPS